MRSFASGVSVSFFRPSMVISGSAKISFILMRSAENSSGSPRRGSSTDLSHSTLSPGRVTALLTSMVARSFMISSSVHLLALSSASFF